MRGSVLLPLVTFRNVVMCENSVEAAGAEFAGYVGALLIRIHIRFDK